MTIRVKGQRMDKIICVGKNYIDHAKELGDAVPATPVIFFKPPSTLQVVVQGQRALVPLPMNQGSVHHECEIVLRVGADAGSFDAVTLGLDLTLRDLQAKLKKEGHPWEISKVFASAAVIFPWINLREFTQYLEVPFRFFLDGVEKQVGTGTQMTFSPLAALNFAKEHFPILPGDLLFTGTPAGVGALKPGQVGRLQWGANTLGEVEFCAG